jgi:hypothetical protein
MAIKRFTKGFWFAQNGDGFEQILPSVLTEPVDA